MKKPLTSAQGVHFLNLKKANELPYIYIDLHYKKQKKDKMKAKSRVQS
jgi:hypothetical protein